MPENFVQTPEGRVLISNGMQPVLRWDGLSTSAENAGVLAPVNDPAGLMTITGSGFGGIVGDYQAYVRFVDQYDNVSDLSPVTATTTIQSNSMPITNVTGGSPIVVTSTAHGLTTGTVVLISGVGGIFNANTSWTITVIDPNTFSLDGSDGFGNTYTTGGTWATGVAQLSYNPVPLPAEAKVRRRQILRNTAGQLTTFYVDVDTNDLVSSTLTSTNTDQILAVQEAIPLLDSNGLPFANSHGLPPAHKKVMVSILGRIFAGVEINYQLGNVAVTFGSAIVQGIGTDWKESFPGRVLYVRGATEAYSIQSINVATQTITLTTPYQGATNPFSRYTIRPAPAEARLVYYSEAGASESWPAINAVSIDADGDEITGLMAVGSYLFIAERSHIYRLTFQSDPATDGQVFLGISARGLLNQRCFASIEDRVYCLDEQGIHAFDGGNSTEPISMQIQDMFRFDVGLSPYEVNWAASDYFHVVHYPPQETLRWFVALSGHYLPRHAICYSYRFQKWWVEEFAHPIGASVRGLHTGRSVVYLGADAGRVLAYWTNLLDGPDPGSGTVRGTVTSATLLSLTDANAAFPPAAVVGSPVVIVDGTGLDQVRRVIAVSGQTLTIDRPWLKLPDATSVYQLGGVPWQWRSSWFRYTHSEEQTERRFEIVFDPTLKPGLLRVRLLLDNQLAPVVWKTRYSSQDASGISSLPGSTDLVIDLTKLSGFAQKRLDARKETYIDGPRYMMLDLRGVVNADEVRINQVVLDGVMS